LENRENRFGNLVVSRVIGMHTVLKKVAVFEAGIAINDRDRRF
jgi:hypothetical protein